MLMQKDENTDINKEEENQASTWKFNKNNEQALETASTSDKQPDISWTALEYAHHEKNAVWYVVLAAVAAGFAVLVYFINNKSIVSPLAIIAFAIMFAVLASRKPRELEYRIDETGIFVDNKLYPYADYKSFMIVEEDELRSIWLHPIKRFNLIVPIYFQPEDEKKIVDTIANIIPIQNQKLDLISQLMHYVHF